MAQGKYYVRDPYKGEKVFRDTLAEINAVARRLANKLGEAVQVYGSDTRKSHRQASYARNPVIKDTPYTAQMPHGAAYVIRYTHSGQKFNAFYTSKENAEDAMQKMLARGTYTPRLYRIVRNMKRNPIGSEFADASRLIVEARHAAKNAARDRGARRRVAHEEKRAPRAPVDVRGKTAPGREAKAAKRAGKPRSANPYEPGSMGAAIWDRQYAANPATPAVKARKKAAHKRGCYVEYKFGTKPERIKCGNKGIATIRANELKRSGAKGVRIIQA